MGLPESRKRLFASRCLTVERLLQVCQLFRYTLAGLARLSQAANPQLHCPAVERASNLVKGSKLLLTAVCRLNHWEKAGITARYRLNEAEVLERTLLLAMRKWEPEAFAAPRRPQEPACQGQRALLKTGLPPTIAGDGSRPGARTSSRGTRPANG